MLLRPLMLLRPHMLLKLHLLLRFRPDNPVALQAADEVSKTKT